LTFGTQTIGVNSLDERGSEVSKKKINAKEVLKDIKAGMLDNALMNKYELSPGQLKSLKKKLVDAGFLKPPEPEVVAPAAESPIDYAFTTCPACGYGQAGEFDDCPRCGVVISKYEPPKQPPPPQQTPEGAPKPPNLDAWPEETSRSFQGLKIIVALAAVLAALVALVLIDKHRKAIRAAELATQQQKLEEQEELTEEERLEDLTSRKPKNIKEMIDDRIPNMKPINPELDRHMHRSLGEVGDRLDERSRARDNLTNQP
jgi:hypothetical protein